MSKAILGRPTTYTDELSLYICEKISEGGNLGFLCKNDPKFPKSRTQLYKWTAKHPIFRDRYTKAMHERRQHMYDDMKASILQTQHEIKAGVYTGAQVNGVTTMAKILADADQWHIARSAPVKYIYNTSCFKLDQSASYSEQSKQVLEAISDGTLSAEQGSSLMSGIKTSFEIRSGELEDRVAKLEDTEA